MRVITVTERRVGATGTLRTRINLVEFFVDYRTVSGWSRFKVGLRRIDFEFRSR